MFIAVLALTVLGFAPAALANGNGAGGVSGGPAFYVDGETYRTVGTPTDFLGTGAPHDSFDTIYAMSQQLNVAESKPGDRDYNGGRWMVHAISFSNYDGALNDAAVNTNNNDVLDSAEEVEAAIDAHYAVDDGVVRSFECPVIRFPANG